MNTASGHNPTHRTVNSTLGLYLLLASLAMLFLASFAAYIIFRFQVQAKSATERIDVPALLWASTAVMVISSLTIHQSLAALKRRQQNLFQVMLLITFILATLFLCIQTPCIVNLLDQHFELVNRNMPQYGLVFFLVLLHALHVIGGILPMAWILKKAYANRYSHDHHTPVKNMIIYWHFLDLAWLAMFAMFLIVA